MFSLHGERGQKDGVRPGGVVEASCLCQTIEGADSSLTPSALSGNILWVAPERPWLVVMVCVCSLRTQQCAEKLVPFFVVALLVSMCVVGVGGV